MLPVHPTDDPNFRQKCRRDTVNPGKNSVKQEKVWNSSEYTFLEYNEIEQSIYIILAASPLASSGFAAIGCFRASPYGGIYILKNYSKLTAKKSANFFFSKIQNFFCLKPSPDQDGTNKKRIFQIGPSVPEKIGFKHTCKDTYKDRS